MNKAGFNTKRAGRPARFVFSTRVGAANGNLFFCLVLLKRQLLSVKV